MHRAEEVALAVECLGQRLCDPCSHLEGLTKPGVLKGLANRGGLRADVVTGGEIAPDGSRTPLTALPGGSTNVWARTLGIPNDVVDATEHLLRLADAQPDCPFTELLG